MPFSEKIRLEVRRRAAFMCCRCREVGVEVHHIVPEALGGPNTLNNAAPLCPNCHESFGDNPRKRKEITQMRDLWYEVVEEKWPTGNNRYAQIDSLLAETQQGHARQAEVVAELARELRNLQEQLRRDPEPDTIREVASGLVSATRLGDRVHANVQCRNCGTSVGLLIGSDTCPTCGVAIA